jgi:hypothetical protein
VLPVFFDANPKPPSGTRSFDVPAGVSVTSAEFTLPVGGWLRAPRADIFTTTRSRYDWKTSRAENAWHGSRPGASPTAG